MEMEGKSLDDPRSAQRAASSRTSRNGRSQQGSGTAAPSSSFLDCYTPDHWSAAIRVLRYLKGTRSLSLVLGCDRSPSLVGYSDSDYANCVDTSRLISGHCHSLGAGVISWSSKKQKVVADSSCYAEYIALHDASHETLPHRTPTKQRGQEETL